MRRVLSEEQVVEMRLKYKTEKITKTRLAEIYHCSVTTIALWLPKNDKLRREKFSPKAPTHCYKCHEKLLGHERCTNCEILLHNGIDYTNKPHIC